MYYRLSIELKIGNLVKIPAKSVFDQILTEISYSNKRYPLTSVIFQ